MQVEITDVFLRDGLQDEPVIVGTEDKLRVAEAIMDAGIRRLEVASFVNPARVPQMGDAAELFAGLKRRGSVGYTALALNGKGITRAAAAGAREISVVTSASQAHSSANAGASIEEALASLSADVAKHPATRFVAGISTAFTCPFEGEIGAEHLLRVVRAFKSMGISNIGLADTLGTTAPGRLMDSVKYVQDHEPELTYYLHLHNAHGQALETVGLAVDAGITRFDAALGGYGGCPFAPGAAGNLSTGELVGYLHAQGHDTGIDESALAEATALAQTVVASAPALSPKELPTR
ncbi:hydroxymethylglutaryl-CoA lyase [Arthrobacter sp. MYb211]|uniref:hydroxymethylglutaryl-CoA lyase n=1 Tax=unclassified Arthrobacter TaxID=235627 RepID=UPI000CFCC019|nr:MULTISPECIES: hydroxymethylglutaryl-CoA lyase [unclassified Arthrobacter]PRA08262.1 hydroxymethylglutaryl-CoA lyase [Arthrobacter sp. MYb221]PRC02876.1 hydroxymethylglutaryl-CoA lyase [Arthrobacter sp. MYb211]